MGFKRLLKVVMLIVGLSTTVNATIFTWALILIENKGK